MGARHLIAAVIDGDFKIANYGQWDGYPDGQGTMVLDFFHETDLEAFKAKLRGCYWLDQAGIDKVNKTPDWASVYPHLSRNAGAEVLFMVDESENGLGLVNSASFAGDSLFCEWAYVLDFDKEVLECYRGFNKYPTPDDSRFPSGADWLDKTDEYEPIRLLKTYPFKALPDAETFVTELTELADDEAYEAQMEALTKAVVTNDKGVSAF